MRTPHMRDALALIGACLLGSGCGPRSATVSTTTGGTLVVALPAEPSSLFPPFALSQQERLVVDQVFEHLADIGDDLNVAGDKGFLPRLAEKWAWSSDSLSIAFHLNPRARWHDGVPVTAEDVRYTFRLYVDSLVGAPTAASLEGIDSVSVSDALTATFWFKRRYQRQFYDAAAQMFICPFHLLHALTGEQLRQASFGHRPVGTGPFRFASWTAGSTLDIVADTSNYLRKPRIGRVVLLFASDAGAAKAKLLTGEADFYEGVRPEDIPDIERVKTLRVVSYPNPAYSYLLFNSARSSSHVSQALAATDLRRALAMAVDRDQIVRSAFDTFAVVARGPFAMEDFYADSSTPQIPFDPVAANRLLDSLGWLRSADGIRKKLGRRLAFRIMVPTSSKPRTQVALLLQDQFKRIGADVSVDAMEIRAFMSAMQSHAFDAAIVSIHTDPSTADFRETWGAKGGGNFASFNDNSVDAEVDSADMTTEPKRARSLMRKAYSQVSADVPAIWLYEQRGIAAIGRRFQPAPFRADAWWAHLDEWYVVRGQEIERDRASLRSTASASP